MIRVLTGVVTALEAVLTWLWLLLTGVVTALEAVLTWLWLRGSVYVLRYGAEENPYAAEDAEIAGICALMLLPLFLFALAWMGYRISKKRAGACEER